MQPRLYVEPHGEEGRGQALHCLQGALLHLLDPTVRDEVDGELVELVKPGESHAHGGGGLLGRLPGLPPGRGALEVSLQGGRGGLEEEQGGEGLL